MLALAAVVLAGVSGRWLVRRQLVRANFKLTPKGIIEELDLRKPIYKKTAAFGHFGREEDGFTWETVNKAAKLKADAGVQV